MVGAEELGRGLPDGGVGVLGLVRGMNVGVLTDEDLAEWVEIPGERLGSVAVRRA